MANFNKLKSARPNLFYPDNSDEFMMISWASWSKASKIVKIRKDDVMLIKIIT